MNYWDYKQGVDFWISTNFDPNTITTEQLKDVFLNKTTPVWLRSLDYYQTNLMNYEKSITTKTKFYPNPLDDEYIRTYILPKLPTSSVHSLNLSEISCNWQDPLWCFEHIRDLITLIENMYVKKSVKENLKNNTFLPKGPYHSWLTRVIQYINTYKGEIYLADILGFFLDNANHNTLHDGYATEEESLPDFKLSQYNDYAELKICSEAYFKEYCKKLKLDYENTLKNDFHKKDNINLCGALFLIKGEPLKLYSIDLTSYETAQYYTDKTAEVDLSKLKIILSDDKGKIPSKDWPAIPCALMFGLKALWLK